jgi:hypothetical protein
MFAELYVERIFLLNYELIEPHYREALGFAKASSPDSEEYELASQEAEFWHDAIKSVGCFRDKYDASCLLAQLGLSWLGDVAPLLTERDELDEKGVRWLLNEVRSRRIEPRPWLNEEQELVVHLGDKRGLHTTTDGIRVSYDFVDVQFFVLQKAKLIDLLITALERNETVICSL